MNLRGFWRDSLKKKSIDFARIQPSWVKDRWEENEKQEKKNARKLRRNKRKG